MSFEREAPELSQEDSNAAKTEFVEAVKRDLIIAGEWTPTAQRIVMERMWDRLRLTPIIDRKTNEITRVDTIYIGAISGSRYKANNASDDVIAEARATDVKAAFGADPKPMLVARLVELGIPQHEAQQYAGRVQREADGRVGWRGASGMLYASSAIRLEELNEAGRAEYLSPKRALAEATKAILAERKAEAARNSPAMDAARARVQGAF